MPVLAEALREAMALQGALSGAIVDLENGTCLARQGGEEALNLSLASIVHARMLRAQIRMVRESNPGSQEGIQDLLITLDHHYHLLRLIRGCDDESSSCLFVYLVMDREHTNLVLARRKLAELDKKVSENVFDLEELTAPAPPAEPSRYSIGLSKGNEAPASEEELPSFMRPDSVMRMLGLSSAAGDAQTP